MEGGPIAEQPIELIRSMFDVNVFGDWNWLRVLLKNLLNRKKPVRLCLPHRWEVSGRYLMLLLIVLQNMRWKLLPRV